MPHVIVKLWPGKSKVQKTRLAEAITKDVMSIFHYGNESVSSGATSSSCRFDYRAHNGENKSDAG